MKRVLVFVFSACLSLYSHGQQKADIDPEIFIESLFSLQDEDLNYEDFYETLFQLFTKPINLNSASTETLLSTYLLSIYQVNQLVAYRDNFGKLLSIYELQAIPGFDMLTIRKILPFVTVTESGKDNRKLIRRIMEEPDSYLMMRTTSRLERSKGYKEGNYRGDPFQHYIRYRNSHVDDYSLGFTLEKDAGEKFEFNNKTQGFDFYSAHFQLKNQGVLENLVIGDFQAQFGQGLVFGAGFSPGKGAETVNSVKRSNTGLRAYTSVVESGFFRGTGASFSGNKWRTTLLYSRAMQNARLQSDTSYSDFEAFVNSINVTGLHRTESELAAKNSLKEQNMGVVYEWKPSRNFNLGFSHLRTYYSLPLQKRPNNYNQFEFSGSVNYVSSVFTELIVKNLLFFGEAAQSVSGGTGLVTGVVTSLSPKWDMSVLYRNYTRNYHTFYGNGFSEGNRIINEKGFYWGLKWQPTRKHLLSAYYDVFEFPWLRFRVEAPSVGSEYLLRYSFSPSRNIQMYVQYRNETKQRTYLPANENLLSLTNTYRQNLIYNFDMKVNAALSFKSRVQTSSFDFNITSSRGIAMVQDINYQMRKWRFSARYALFNGDDFETRQYVYEKDVLYGFSIPAYNGRGTRTYLLVQHQLNQKIKVWAKIGRFVIEDVTSLGSGNESFSGNTRTDVRVQMMVNL